MEIDLQSVHNFFKWAEIEKDGWIEVNYLHYENGKYSRIASSHTKHPEQFELPKMDNLLCTVGVNPRTGKEGCAHDKDIQIFKNLYIDIEPIHAPNTNVTEDERLKMLAFIYEEDWSKWIPASVPFTVADSGNGAHIVIAIPPYDNPLEFGNKLQTWYKTRLLPETKSLREKYNVRIDSTFSPSRQVKLYGTKKPIEGSRLSSFPAVPRVESADFRDYILSFPEKMSRKVTVDIDLQVPTLTLEEIEERYGLTR